VDTQRLVLLAKIHSTLLQDLAAVPFVLEGVREQFPYLEHV
jgi:hypothetical protein